MSIHIGPGKANIFGIKLRVHVFSYLANCICFGCSEEPSQGEPTIYVSVDKQENRASE